MVDPKDTLRPGASAGTEAAETAGERMAAEQQALKEEALRRQAIEQPKAWWQQALGAAANIKEAADQALVEANAKRALELEQQQARGGAVPNFFKRQRREGLFEELDRALDAGNFERAAEIQRQIDAL